MTSPSTVPLALVRTGAAKIFPDKMATINTFAPKDLVHIAELVSMTDAVQTLLFINDTGKSFEFGDDVFNDILSIITRAKSKDLNICFSKFTLRYQQINHFFSTCSLRPHRVKVVMFDKCGLSYRSQRFLQSKVREHKEAVDYAKEHGTDAPPADIEKIHLPPV